MAIYSIYATLSDLASYLDVLEEDLPSESTRLLTRASELVYQLSKIAYDSDDDDNVEAVKLATCAQVEYWFTAGESVSITVAFEQMKLGEFSFKSSTKSQSSQNTSPRAISYLEEQALLFRGIKIK